MKFILGLILSSIILLTAGQIADQKNFWNDEAFEICELSQRSWGEILSGHVLQASKNPLYLGLQKLVVSFPADYDSSLLIYYRLISLVCASLLALTLFLFFQKRFGLAWAIFGLLALTGQKLFYLYAAENRPYLLWIYLFTVLIILTVKLAEKKWSEASRVLKISFAVTCALISLTLAFGVIQSCFAVGTILFFWYFVQERPKNFHPFLQFALPIVFMCAAIEGFYASHGVDAHSHNVFHTEFDLVWQLQQKNYGLLKMPWRILLPKIGRDAFIGSYLSNILIILSSAATFYLWRRRSTLNQNEKFILILNIAVLAQVAATLPIAFIVGFLRYWFVQRIFLYLIICHVLLAVTGAYFIFSRLQKYRIIIPISLTIFLGLCVLSVTWYRDIRDSYTIPVAECAKLPGRLPEILQEEAMLTYEGPLVLAMDVSKHLDRCGWNGTSQKAYIWHDARGWEIDDSLPLGQAPLQFCKKPVVIKIKD